MYDKSDSFMDLFNSMFWAYDDGRYTEWGSVYPPLSFLILKLINYLCAGSLYGDANYIRDNSLMVVFGFFIIYLISPILVLRTNTWREFPRNLKIAFYFLIIFSTPMLFALERGNLIVLAPIFLAFAISKTNFIRVLAIAVLINIKPYFALLIIYYWVRRDWNGFVACTLVSGLIFLITGMVVDSNFLYFFPNLLNFSHQDELFSIREVMTMPSSISAFSYILNHPDGSKFVAAYLDLSEIKNIAGAIETTKWAVILTSLIVLMKKSAYMLDAEIFCLLVVLISNLGIWVGGYSVISYIAFIPVFIQMRGWRLYSCILTVIAMPIDILPLMNDFIGYQFSYLSNSVVGVDWTMGLGSIIRPSINIFFLLMLAIDFGLRKSREKNKMTDYRYQTVIN